jgi:hypothetical protein
MVRLLLRNGFYAFTGGAKSGAVGYLCLLLQLRSCTAL